MERCFNEFLSPARAHGDSRCGVGSGVTGGRPATAGDQTPCREEGRRAAARRFVLADRNLRYARAGERRGWPVVVGGRVRRQGVVVYAWLTQQRIWQRYEGRRN